MNLGQHDIGLRLGEEAAALDRGKLGRIAQNQNLLAERQQVAAELLVDHGTFVDDDQAGGGGRRVLVQFEGRLFGFHLLWPVDHGMDGAGVRAAPGAHDQRRLSGEGAESGLAVDAFGEMTGERRLARAGIAEEAEDLRRLALGKPRRDGFERAVLFGRPVHGAI